MKKIGLLALVLAASIFVTELQMQATACPEQCNTNASCTGGCSQWQKFGWKCSDTIAHPNPGKVCGKADDGTCQNSTSVKCGLNGYKSCPPPPAAPDCDGIDHNMDIYEAGCQA